MNTDKAYELAVSDAKWAIDIARNSGDEVVVFITGNRYMPAMRDLPNGETVWQAEDDNVELWVMYAETFEDELARASVYLGSPDYDNCLYVVDCARFEYVNEDAHTLSDEWAAIS